MSNAPQTIRTLLEELTYRQSYVRQTIPDTSRVILFEGPRGQWSLEEQLVAVRDYARLQGAEFRLLVADLQTLPAILPPRYEVQDFSCWDVLRHCLRHWTEDFELRTDDRTTPPTVRLVCLRRPVSHVPSGVVAVPMPNGAHLPEDY